MQELERSKKYADDLVEHSNMPCLPADLRNLRQTNEHLAVENEHLKKENNAKYQNYFNHCRYRTFSSMVDRKN